MNVTWCVETLIAVVPATFAAFAPPSVYSGVGEFETRAEAAVGVSCWSFVGGRVLLPMARYLAVSIAARVRSEACVGLFIFTPPFFWTPDCNQSISASDNPMSVVRCRW
eukprot:8189636-Lingulodinium_polyedra.AAC.1